MAPKFSEIFSFLTILDESIEILPKIWKFVVPVTAVSLTLASLLLLIFSYSYQTLMTNITQEPELGVLNLGILLVAELSCLFLFITACNVSGSSTITASAACYTGKHYSPSELLSGAAAKTVRNPLNRGSFCSSKTAIFLSVVVGLLTGVVIGVHMINPITVCLLFLLWVGSIAFALRSTATGALVGVVWVVEENCDSVKAEERSEQLTEGQRLKAYMLTLSANVFVAVIFLVSWVVMGDRGSENLRMYGFIGVNLVVVVRVCSSVVYTVFYFQCKKHHGEVVEDEQDVHKLLPAAP